MTIIDIDKWHEIISALKKNKLRTFLTGFGVFWGIFMLVIMLGSGNGLQNGTIKGFKDFATNSFFIWTQQTTIPYKGFPQGRYFNFNNDDIKAIRDNCPEVGIIAPKMQGWGGEGGNNASRGDKTGAFTIDGNYPEFIKVDPIVLVMGRYINNLDIQEKRKVAVLGKRVYEVLFKPGENAIGQYILIKGIYFQVVGVIKPKNENINMGGDKQQTITLPFTTLQKVYNYGDIVGYFSITSKPNIPASVAEAKVRKLLAQRHSVSPDDKEALGGFNLEEEFNKMTGLFLGIQMLIWIVGIGTLLAGVIGVSNIMLVIVKERTKEIGIKRAIGATPWAIMSQIIVESIFLTSFAGYFGLVSSVGLLGGVSSLIQSGGGGEGTGMFANPEIDINIAMIALLILIVAGAFAGMIPARRAISIKPIDALRTE